MLVFYKTIISKCYVLAGVSVRLPTARSPFPLEACWGQSFVQALVFEACSLNVTKKKLGDP